MRIINIEQGLWLDEIWSMSNSAPEKSISEVINACKTDTHPPFFDILLNVFLKVFGSEDINGRILALIIACIGLPATFYYARKISGNKVTGFLAFTFISFSFFHVYYSGEGRFYTLLYLLSLVTISETYLFLRDKKISNLIIFSIAGILIIYTHYYGAILLFVLSILVFILWILKEINIKTVLQIFIANVVVLLSFLPWIPYMFGSNTNDSWISTPGLGHFFHFLYLYTGKNPVELIFIIASLIFSIRYFKTNVKFYTIMLGTIFLGFLIPFIISHLVVPMLHYRYTFIYFPCIVILVASFIAEWKVLKAKFKIISIAVLVFFALLNFFFINPYIENGREEPWEEIAEILNEKNPNSEEIIYADTNFPLNYYLQKHELKNSRNLPTGQYENSFWLLKTPFDSRTPKLGEEFKSVEVLEFKGRFLLSYYKREN